MREQTARGARGRRATRTLQLTDVRRGRADHPAQPADEPAGLGPRPHRPAGGPVAAARRRRGRAGAAGVPDRAPVRRLRAPARHPRRPAAAHAAPRRGASSPTCAAASSTGSTASTTPPPERLFPYVMVEQHEQQHVETMLATHQLRAGEPLLGTGCAAAARAGACPATPCWCPAGPFVLGVDGADRAVVAGQRAARAHGRPAGVPDRAGAGHQRRVAARSSRPAATTEPQWWSERGWAHRVEAGLERPLFWSADGSRRRFGARRGDPGRRAGAARLLLRGRGVRRVGRRPAARPSRSGRRRAPGTPRAAPPALAVGRLGVDARPGQPRRASAASRAGRRLPGGRLGVRRRADDRRRVGVDLVGVRAVARLRADALRRLQRAVLRRRLPRAARRLVGGRRGVGPAVLPQLGPPDPPADLQRGCDWPGTLCRHLAWLGEPRTLASLVLEPEHGLLRQSYQPRRQRTA